MLFLNEIRKNEEGISFDKTLDIKEELLKRNQEIIDIKDVHVIGQVVYEDGLYLLNYHSTYTIILPSSRSMKEVPISQEENVSEIFVAASDYEEKKDIVEEALALIVEGDSLNLEESVIDNILLSIPLRVLAPDEEEGDALPSGEDWTVMTETQFEEMKSEKKKESNPFSALDGLF